MNHLHCIIYIRDDDYLREIRAGGSRAESAISCLYLKYRKRTLSYMRMLISKHPEFKGFADDLVHDAFIIMVNKIRYETIDIRSLAGFWIGIGKKIFLNQLKKDQRIILVEDVEEKYGYEYDLNETVLPIPDENERLENAFLQLGPRCREILLLWINQYTMNEITEKMNLTNVAMARKMKYECFKKLKDFLKSGNKMGV
jgi:DNA-directed RNA polymerase specialized sigma24 family protein